VLECVGWLILDEHLDGQAAVIGLRRRPQQEVVVVVLLLPQAAGGGAKDEGPQVDPPGLGVLAHPGPAVGEPAVERFLEQRRFLVRRPGPSDGDAEQDGD